MWSGIRCGYFVWDFTVEYIYGRPKATGGFANVGFAGTGVSFAPFLVELFDGGGFFRLDKLSRVRWRGRPLSSLSLFFFCMYVCSFVVGRCWLLRFVDMCVRSFVLYIYPPRFNIELIYPSSFYQDASQSYVYT